jgi:diaminopimelate decarboxylase
LISVCFKYFYVKHFALIHTFDSIGGGFPGTSITKVTFDETSKAVNEALDQHFPAIDEFGNASNITIIAEPGRYYVSSFRLSFKP